MPGTLEHAPALVALGVLAALVAACRPAHDSTALDAAPVPGTPAGISLATAVNAVTPLGSEGPQIAVDGAHVTLDGTVVGDVGSITASGRMTRIDALFDGLKKDRDDWKAAHPVESFRGVVRLAFDHATPAVVVKSVFQTAAFAGYPNEQLTVRTPQGDVGHLDVDAVVPGPPGAPIPGDRLRVEVTRDKFVLVWQASGTVVSSVDVPTSAELPERLQETWTERSAHQAPSDLALDQAVVHLANDVDFDRVVGALDAVAGTKRDAVVKGQPARVAAFGLSLGIVPPVEGLTEGATAPDPLGGGRIAPEIIQRIVRQRFGVFKKCFNAGLTRDPSLSGKVSVHFVIAEDGSVSDVRDEKLTLPDPQVISCVLAEFPKLTFPRPHGGKVTVVYPIDFTTKD